MILSPKEVKVISLVALGYSDKEIASKMKISYGTVRTYVDRVVLKLKAKNRTHAAIIYIMNNKKMLKEIYEKYSNSLDCGKALPF